MACSHFADDEDLLLPDDSRPATAAQPAAAGALGSGAAGAAPAHQAGGGPEGGLLGDDAPGQQQASTPPRSMFSGSQPLSLKPPQVAARQQAPAAQPGVQPFFGGSSAGRAPLAVADSQPVPLVGGQQLPEQLRARCNELESKEQV